MSGAIRIHSTSRGLDAARLLAGRDLVLELDEAHGVAAPEGVLAGDALDVEARRALDRSALAGLARWRELYDELLTVDGICLPFIAEWPLMRTMLAWLRLGEGLHAAVGRHGATALELMDDDDRTRQIASVVAARHDIPVRTGAGPRAAVRPVRELPRISPLRRARRLAVRGALGCGAPTLLRPGSVLVLSYWPMMPLLDRLLDEPTSRPAIALEARPTGPSRTMRAALQGGWLGLPSPWAVGAAKREVEAAITRVGAATPRLEVGSFDLGACVHGPLLMALRDGACDALARAGLVRRALERSPPQVVVAYCDSLPIPRLVVSLARDAGVRTLVVAHGAFLAPQTVADLSIGEEVAVWSQAVAPPGVGRRARVHVIGYPARDVPNAPIAVRRRDAARRIVVLGQERHPYTAMIDERSVQRHYLAALGAVRSACPGATVVLRPHPTQQLAPIRRLLDEIGDLDTRIDATSSIEDLLASAALCVASLSTAALQAALVDTPVIALNLTGFEWPWPLGGDTPVPVAHSTDELVVALRDWRRRRRAPGREALLAALGADRPNALDRLVDVVTGRPPDRDRAQASSSPPAAASA
ncbi:MAG: hypothetical protein QOI62_2272 [Solirubrobacteraceae bacterium]|jgi:hypothetical protein|nr:hypothetical protein [Solirubrobacteraceae bacterium]